MNRYYWIALCLILILLTALSTIWILGLANQDQRETMSVLFTVIGTFAAIIFGILGLIESKRSETNVAISIPSPKKEIVSELLNKENSILYYLSNLEATLDSVSRFVLLNTEYEQDAEENIIHLLQSFEWAKREHRLRLETVTKKPVDFVSAHEHFQRYVLLGDPGSGKTTCLQYLTQKLIAGYREDSSRLIPFYVRLSEWKDHRTSAIEFLRIGFEKLAGSTSYLAKEFESLLSRGDLLIILDGLNEMPGRRYYHEEKDLEIADSVKILREVTTGDAFRSKQDPRERSLRELALSGAVRTRFVLSCRTHEFFESPKWQEVHVLPMNLEQVSSFLTIYMGEKGRELQSILETNSALMNLAKNPFFLRSMIRVYSPEISLIENKGRFLEYLCDQLFTRELNRGLIFDKRKLMAFISRFAFNMIKKGLVGIPVEIKNEIKKNQQLVNILIGTGLMTPRGEKHISFYHQIIQEFFAAYALRENFVKSKLSKLLTHKKWSEVVVLWHDIDPSSSIFTKLIDSLKNRNRPWTKPYSKSFGLILYDYALLLFYIYFLTNIVVDLFFSNSFITKLLMDKPLLFFLFLTVPLAVHHIWLFSSYHLEAISNAAFVLGRIKNPIAIEHLIDSFKRANASIRHAEISESISQFGDIAFASVLSGLNSTNTHVKLGCIQTLGKLKNSKAVDPLINILKTGSAILVAPTMRALGQIGDPKAAQAISETIKLIEKMAFPASAYNQVFPTLNQIKEVDTAILERIINDLRESVNKNRSLIHRYTILQAIGIFGHPSCKPILLDIVHDEGEDKIIRYHAISALAYIRDSDIPDVIVNIYHRFDDLKKEALDALENVNYPNAIQSLHMLLDHADWRIRKSAISSIAKMGNLDSLDLLLAKHTDEREEVRAELSKGIGILGFDDVLPTLLILVRDPSTTVRQESLNSLDLAFPNIAHQKFLELANETDYPERIKVVEFLGNYRSSEVRATLRSLCIDSNNEVKTQAVKSLHRIDQNLSAELRYVRIDKKSRSVFNPLIKMLDKYKTTYSALTWQAKRQGLSEQERTTWIIQQLQNDAELKRENRSFFILLNLVLITLFVIAPPVLGATVPRVSIYLGNIFWANRWFFGLFVALALVSMLPKIRYGAKIKVLKDIYEFIRFAGFTVLVVSLLGLGSYYWWICLPLMILAGIGAFYWRNYRYRKRT